MACKISVKLIFCIPSVKILFLDIFLLKAIDDKNKVVFYPIKKEIDTIDGMWVSGLPNEVKLIITGQEYITVGQTVEIE